MLASGISDGRRRLLSVPRRAPASGGADPFRTEAVLRWRASASGVRASKSGRPFTLLGFGCATFRSEIDSVPFFVFVSLIHERIHFSHLDLHTRSALIPMLVYVGTSRSRSSGKELYSEENLADFHGIVVEVEVYRSSSALGQRRAEQR